MGISLLQTREYEVEDLIVYVQRTEDEEFKVIALKDGRSRQLLKLTEEDQERIEARALKLAQDDIWIGPNEEE